MKTAFFFSALILAVNLLMINLYGTDVPFWDQWDSEAELYIKWEEHTLTPQDLIKPHVQHRFAVSRLLRIVLYELLGGWSPWGNMIFQSFLVPLIFLVFFIFVRNKPGWLDEEAQAFLPPGVQLANENPTVAVQSSTLRFPYKLRGKWKRSVFYAISAVVFLVPLYWEVILLGFQSHFYLSIIFGLLLILLAARPPDVKILFWFLLIGLVNSFTSASSLAPLLVCLAIQLISLVGFEQKRQVSLLMLGITVFLLVFNIKLLVFPENQQQFGAHGFWDLVWLSLQAFSWPVEYLGILCLWLIPLAVIICRYRVWSPDGMKRLVSCILRDRANLALFGFLLWLVLSIGSIAFARGNYALFVSRYMNIYGFTLYTPFLLYLLFFDGSMELRFTKRVSRVLLILYVLLAAGWAREGFQEFQRCLLYKRDMDRIKMNLVTALRLDDSGYLFSQQQIKYTYGGHPNPARVFTVLKHPALRGKHLWLQEKFRK